MSTVQICSPAFRIARLKTEPGDSRFDEHKTFNARAKSHKTSVFARYGMILIFVLVLAAE